MLFIKEWCTNPGCGYFFFEKEEYYICCPYCGKLKGGYYERRDKPISMLDERLYKFHKFLKIRDKYLIACYCYSFIAFIMIIIILGGFYMLQSTGDSFSDAVKLSAFMIDVVLGILTILFLPFRAKLRFFRKYIGEYAWYLNTIYVKAIKWLIMLAAFFFINTVLIPYMYNLNYYYYSTCGVSIKALKFKMFIIKLEIHYMMLFCLIMDIYELIRRDFCLKV